MDPARDLVLEPSLGEREGSCAGEWSPVRNTAFLQEGGIRKID